jgi:hypothetical protein
MREEKEQFAVGTVIQGRDLIDTYVLLTVREKDLVHAIENLRGQTFELRDAEKDERMSVQLLVDAYKANQAKLQGLRVLPLEILSF